MSVYYGTFFQRSVGGFYFRIIGFGLALGCDRKVRFSERYCYRKCWRLGRWDLMILTPRH